MKKILILGGTGFVGAQVCEQLVRDGWHLTVLTRRRRNAQHLLHLPPLTVLEVDVHDEAALTQALVGHDAVVNLVAILHGDEAAFHRVHVALPDKLARACRASGVTQLVHISALGVNGRQPESAPSMYLRSKGQGEAVLAQAAAGGALALTCLRPSVIFGAGDRFLNVFAGLQKYAPVVPLACAEARFQPVWVGDVARAVVQSLTPWGGGVGQDSPRIVELCGPQVFTLRQLVQLAGRLSGVRGGRGRPVIGLPAWLGRLQASLMALKPGEPLMTADNLDSMRTDNVASGAWPDLASLGICPRALGGIAGDYLTASHPARGLVGLRAKRPGTASAHADGKA